MMRHHRQSLVCLVVGRTPVRARGRASRPSSDPARSVRKRDLALFRKIQCVLSKPRREGTRSPSVPLFLGWKVASWRPTVYTSIVYTEVVLDKIEGFDWDNANLGHILRHAVTPSKSKRSPSANTSSSPREPSNARGDGSCLARRHPGGTWSWCSRFDGSCSEP